MLALHKHKTQDIRVRHDTEQRRIVNAPFSKTLARSTLTRSSVWPCDLCIDIAHDRISGSLENERIQHLDHPITRLPQPALT